MSPSPERPYNYAEGASTVEIDEALSGAQPIPTGSRTRRDSQVGSAYSGDDGEGYASGAIFDGYGAHAIPSSVTSMHHDRVITWSRDRRRSIASSRRSRAAQQRASVDDSAPLSSGIVRRDSGERDRDQDTDGGLSASDDELETVGAAASEYEEEGRPSIRSRSSHKQRPTSRHSQRAASESFGRGVFGSLSGIFSRQSLEIPSRPDLSSITSDTSRRRGRSRRTSIASSARGVSEDVSDDEEMWGYSSGEEEEIASPDEATSLTPSYIGDDDSFYARSENDMRPQSPTTSLPILAGANDPIFGDTRMEMSVHMGYQEFSTKPIGGPPSRQRVHLEDEDTTVLFVGCRVITWRKWAWRVAVVCTFGLLGLAGRWAPTLWLKWVTQERAFEKLGHDDSKESLIVVETPFRDVFIHQLITAAYPDKTSSIFPRSTQDVSSRSSHTPGNATPRSAHRLSLLNGIADPVHLGVHDLERGASSLSSPSGVLRYVDYRYARFVFDDAAGKFKMLRDWRDPAATSLTRAREGIDNHAQMCRMILFGRNLIDVAGKSVFTLLIEEALHPFYVFQIASIILWSIDNYWYYATCIAIISTLSITTTLVETKRTVERMREMSRFSCPVRLLSNGSWITVSSEHLVPGDVVNIMEENLTLFPADMLLLSGDVIVNESMLTGESVPIAKIPVKDKDFVRWNEGVPIDAETAKSFLYTGTKVIRVRGVLTPTSGEQALAVVVRTGFNTTKGSLIRSMLFPKPMGFKFYSDSIRFIVVLAGIAGLGFLASAVQFIKLGIKFHVIVIRALDLITIVVPPALPATLSIGTSFAIGRLRKLGIYCISPNRVNIAGRINVVCFDKTGTLTEDGLDVLGARCIERSGDVFGELTTNVHDLLPSPTSAGKAELLQALATCHSLKVINGEILGDPLDARMFEFTGWTIEEGRSEGAARPGSSRPADLVQAVVRPPGSARFRLEDALKIGARPHFLELGVIRTFEFVSALRRMSVIVKRLKSTSMEIYVKGAPETMADICDPSTFPRDYDDLLAYYTKHGYRVIAIAGKSIEGLSWLKAQRMKREQAEAGLHFLGLIIFENKIKAGTAPAIQVLQNAHLALRMVTGDNHRTAISVARECGIIGQSIHVFIPSFASGNAQMASSTLEWTSVDDELLKLDPYSLKPLPRLHRTADADDIDYQDYTLAITGDVFRWMINNAPVETLQRMFVKAQIFARMSPDEKHELVSRLQTLGYTVGFCGDGANDCGALKAADVGISLSEAEASIAAPFTSSRPDIGCIIELIKEGRGALVTSFSCFKYMALYSLIQFTTITLLYSFASSLGDFQFLYIDLFIIIPIAVTMGRTHPYTSIHRKQPTASLVSTKVLSSIIGQILMTSAFQFWAFFWARAQPWYSPPTQNTRSDELETYNYENTVLFLVSSFQYIFVAAVFSIGPPYRQPMWTNRVLMFSIITLTMFSVLVLIAPPEPFARLLDIITIPIMARFTLLLAAAVNALLCDALERWSLLALVVSHISSYVGGRKKRSVRDGKLYSAVEGGMQW